MGFQVEEQACRYLEQNGYCVICRNFVSRYGEIDIVALEGHTLAFVEVRYRRTGSLVTPQESIDARKANRIRLAVRDFVSRRTETNGYSSIRVDLCAVSGNLEAFRGESGKKPSLEFEVIKGIIDF
ncbi:MAG TPA: YraN family protein [Firmicutes bacterium]|nr:YraN family protein [Candidatus Fermentithermobacillaceae bacterium]